MCEVSLLDLWQAGQLDPVGGVGGKVLSLDREFEDGTHKLVGLTRPRRRQPLTLKAHRAVRRQPSDPHLQVFELDIAQCHIAPPGQHDGVQ